MITTLCMYARYKTCCAGYRPIHTCADSCPAQYDHNLIPRSSFHHEQTSMQSRTWQSNVLCKCKTICSFMALPVRVKPALLPRSSNNSTSKGSVSYLPLSQTRLLIICSNVLIKKAFMTLCALEANAVSIVP